MNQLERRQIKEQLQCDEYVVAWLRADLDEQLCFASSLVVLSNRRILASPPQYSLGLPTHQQQPIVWRCWKLEEVADLCAQDRAGLGTLMLMTCQSDVVRWRYTAACAPAIGCLLGRFHALRSGNGRDGEEADEVDTWETASLDVQPRAWSLFRLAKFARPCTGMIVLGFVLSLASTGLSLVPPYLTIPLMDDVLVPYQNRAKDIKTRPAAQRNEQLAELRPEKDRRFILVIWYLAGLAGAAAGAWGLGWAQGAVMARVSERVSANLRNETYSHLVRLSLEYFGSRRTGDLIARISNDTDRICYFLSDTAVDFGIDVLTILGTAGILAWIDPLLAAATLCPLPLIAWLIYMLRARLQHGFQRGGRTWGEMTSILADAIPGIRVVKAFAQESREIERFRTANARIVSANDRVNSLWTFFWPTVAMFNQLGLLVVWAMGAWRVLDLQITVGVLMAFLTYIGRFYGRLDSMSRMFSLTQRAAAGAHRLFEILDQHPTVADPARPVSPGHLQGSIEFCQVGFRYGSRPILSGINLKIRPGEMIGLVGHTGAGKTTLINLICRFYDVTEGGVFVDGTDIRCFPIEEYRRNIGLVLQEPFLFYGPVAENIAYGRPTAAREEIIAAARASRAHDFILQLPDGYDSVVGERGQTLSGGERQRISIARALLIDPKILILDEATSAVDTETEREIQLALENLVQGRTTVAIAHRLSTLRRADRLVVLEHGQIVEVGSHEELLRRSGIYARLYHAQFQMHEGAAEKSVR